MRVLRFASHAPDIVADQPVSAMETHFPTPAEEFMLTRLTLTPGKLYAATAQHNVEILLVTNGKVILDGTRQAPLHLKRGESVLIPAAAGAYRLAGRGVCYKAGVPTSTG